MYLRYRNTIAGEWTEHFFNTLEVKERTSTTRIQRVSLRQVQVDHIVAERRKWKIRIGASELRGAANDGVPFLKGFWRALQREFTNTGSKLTAPEDEDYIRVTTPDGDIPLSWLNDNPKLPTYEMELTEKYGSLG